MFLVQHCPVIQEGLFFAHPLLLRIVLLIGADVRFCLPLGRLQNVRPLRCCHGAGIFPPERSCFKVLRESMRHRNCARQMLFHNFQQSAISRSDTDGVLSDPRYIRDESYGMSHTDESECDLESEH